MDLYVMRHGDAMPVGGAIPDDAQRPLSPSGKIQVRDVAAGLKRRGITLDLIISSPLKRAQETAAELALGLEIVRVDVSAALSPNRSPAGVKALVACYPQVRSLLMIGHHPDVTLWTAYLANLDPSVCPLFSTASITALQWDKKKAEFLWFQTSDQLSHPSK
jgi:phosphohistidine phosphatase